MKKIIKSFGFAFKGIATAFSSEINLRFHCLTTLIVIVAGIYLKVSSSQFSVLLLCCGFVISAEIFNTAIETLTNLVSPAENNLARKTKDLAAAAVLVAAITASVVGLIIFLPKLF